MKKWGKEDIPLRSVMRRQGGRVMDFFGAFPVVEHFALADGIFVCTTKHGRVKKVMTREMFQKGLDVHPETEAVFCDSDSWEQMNRMKPLMEKSLASGIQQSLDARNVLQ